MIDKLMKKYGYEKTDENRYGAYYKKREPQGYDHIVCVAKKDNGKHLMQSYDAQTFKVNNDFINGTVGVEIPILLLMWMKAKRMARKYRWNQRKPDAPAELEEYDRFVGSKDALGSEDEEFLKKVYGGSHEWGETVQEGWKQGNIELD